MLFILNYFEIDFLSNNIQIITYTKLIDIKDPLPLVVALHMTNPAAGKIITLLLELGADLSLPFQDGETIYTYAKKNNLMVGTQSLDEVIENIYKGFCANPTPMQFSKLSGLRFTGRINGMRIENGSLLEKLICDGEFVALETIREDTHTFSFLFFF